jgi:hypothetical protein
MKQPLRVALYPPTPFSHPSASLRNQGERGARGSKVLPSPHLGEGTGVRAISSVSFLFEMTIFLILVLIAET